MDGLTNLLFSDRQEEAMAAVSLLPIARVALEVTTDWRSPTRSGTGSATISISDTGPPPRV